MSQKQNQNDKYNRLFYLQPYIPVYIIVFFFFGSLIWRSSHLWEILRIALIWKNQSRLKIEINLLLEENLIQNVRNLPFVEELQVGSRIAEEYGLVDVLAGQWIPGLPKIYCIILKSWKKTCS